MGSPRARLGLGVRDRGDDGLLYTPPRLFSTKYAHNAQYVGGPSSLHDPKKLTSAELRAKKPRVELSLKMKCVIIDEAKR